MQIASLDGAAVNALPVGLDGQRHREQVLRRQGGVGMAVATGIRKVRLVDWRFGVASRDHRVGGAVATLAGRCVTVHLCMRAAVNARIVLTCLRGVASGAELGAAARRLSHIMGAVASDAG